MARKPRQPAAPKAKAPAARKPRRTVAKPPPPMTVAEAAEFGTDRQELVATRLRVAKAIDDSATRAADLASLTRRLSEIRKEIQAIDAGEVETSDAGEVPDEAFDASAV